MSDADDALMKQLREDTRYRPEAYSFIFDALRYTVRMLGLDRLPDDATREERHVSGQQLLEGVRRLALRQFGFLAKTVFESWGIRTTRDWGEIVFNLIRTGHMNKQERDDIRDFIGGYEHDEALEAAYFRDGLYHEDRIDASVAVVGLEPPGPLPPAPPSGGLTDSGEEIVFGLPGEIGPDPDDDDDDDDDDDADVDIDLGGGGGDASDDDDGIEDSGEDF
ncbi:MAG: Minf_1886 family protein [Planctomycetota bacterium]